jgi:Domain of unknown function (DUF4956)
MLMSMLLLPELQVTDAVAVSSDIDALRRLGIDLACMLVLIRGIYYRTYRRADLFLTFFAFNFIIFLITFALNQSNLSLGAGFGLFAVFSMLRFRTEGISTNDMTYLFLVIALGMLAASSKGSWLQLLGMSAFMLLFTTVLEAGWLARREQARKVLYDNVALVQASSHDALIADLQLRTGLNVHRVDVREIDFLKDTANLTVYFHPETGRD